MANISIRFMMRSLEYRTVPVMAGRFMLAAKAYFTGSRPIVNTTGIVEVIFLSLGGGRIAACEDNAQPTRGEIGCHFPDAVVVAVGPIVVRR